MIHVAEAELAGLVPAPGEHAAVLGDGHAVRRRAAAAHRRDGDALERGDPRGLEDVRGRNRPRRGTRKGDAAAVDARLESVDAAEEIGLEIERAGLPRPPSFQSVMPVKSSSRTTMVRARDSRFPAKIDHHGFATRWALDDERRRARRKEF